MALALYIVGAILSGILYVITLAIMLAKEDTDIEEILNEHLPAFTFIGFVMIALSWLAIIFHFIGFIGIYTYKRVKGKQNATITEPTN